MKCSPLHSRPPVVRDSIHPSMELDPDYLHLVVTGDDSGDDSGDEGPGRGRQEEEEAEETGSPVGQRLKKILLLKLIHIFTRSMKGHLLPRPSCSKDLKRIWDLLQKLTPNSRKNWRR